VPPQVPPDLDRPEYPDDPPAITVRLYITPSSTPAESVSIVASCTAPVYLTNASVNFPFLAGGQEPTAVPFTFRARSEELPTNLAASFVATYTAKGGEVRCARCSIQLPLRLVAAPIPTVKSPAFKVTVEINRPPPPLHALFEDMLEGAPEIAESLGSSGGAPALSLQYHCGLDSTVLASKNNGKYRIQSNAFEGLWLLTDELLRRLQSYFAGSSTSAADPFAVTFNDALPLQEFFDAIEEHLRCRQVAADIAEALEKRAHQFRVVEKRLLVRSLRTAPPHPLGGPVLWRAVEAKEPYGFDCPLLPRASATSPADSSSRPLHPCCAGPTKGPQPGAPG